MSAFTLQQDGNLTTTNRVDVTNEVNLADGLNEVKVPMAGSNLFYPLILGFDQLACLSFI